MAMINNQKEETFEEMVERCSTDAKKSIFSLNVLIDFSRGPIELFEQVITFLSMRHIEGETFWIKSKAGRIFEVTLDLNSGLVFDRVKNREGFILYLGMGIFKIPHHPFIEYKYPAFLLRGDHGVSYWDDILDIECIDESEISKSKLSSIGNINPKKRFLDFGKLINKNQKNFQKSDLLLSESMDILSDAVIHCRDGDVKIVRFLLSKDSEFFLHLFRYESQKREFNMNFDKEVVKTYMERHLYGSGIRTPNAEKICDDVMQYIEFGFFVQDIFFVRFIYELVSDFCDNENILELNKVIENIVSFD
jgi:hypothetical protein